MCLPSCGKAAFWSPIGSNGFNARRAQVRRSAVRARQLRNDMKLYVAMVGLPARGKSTLAKRIRSGLEQQGIRTAIFNNGELRRMLFGLESGSAEFFNPDNTRAQRLRDQITHQNMERARAWLDEGGDVAIIDATNGTVHQRVDLSATLRDRPVLFIECVNDDPLLLDASIRRKTRLPEFANMTQEEALESFRKRLAYYESVYTPVRKERCWIRVDAVDSCIQDEAPSNDLPYYAAIRDIISSRWVQDLYLVRHGETDYNREGLTAGNRHRHVGRNLSHDSVGHQDTDGPKDNIGSGGVVHHRIFPGGTAHCTRLQHGAGCQHIRAHCQQLAIRR